MGMFISFGLSTKSPLTFFSSAQGGWCGTHRPSLSNKLIAFPHVRDSGGIYSLLVYCFLGAHGLVVPPRHVSFLLQEPPEGKLEHKRKNIKKRKTKKE